MQEEVWQEAHKSIVCDANGVLMHFKCRFCGKEIVRQDYFKTHLRRMHHTNLHIEKLPKNFKCPHQLCEWSFYTANELRAHTRNRHSIKEGKSETIGLVIEPANRTSVSQPDESTNNVTEIPKFISVSTSLETKTTPSKPNANDVMKTNSLMLIGGTPHIDEAEEVNLDSDSEMIGQVLNESRDNYFIEQDTFLHSNAGELQMPMNGSPGISHEIGGGSLTMVIDQNLSLKAGTSNAPTLNALCGSSFDAPIPKKCKRITTVQISAKHSSKISKSGIDQGVPNLPLDGLQKYHRLLNEKMTDVVFGDEHIKEAEQNGMEPEYEDDEMEEYDEEETEDETEGDEDDE